MKLLLVSNMYPSRKYPHYGVFVENAEKILKQMPGITVKKAVMKKHEVKAAKLCAYLRFYLQILCRGIFGGYDVIYGHFVSHIALPLRIVKALRPNCKLVLNAHGNDVVADTPADDKWVALSRKILPCADHVIVPSEYFRQVLARDFGVPQDKLFTYPSGGVDPLVFYPRPRESVAAAMQLDEQKQYIGYVSRIETDKGWDTFLEMAAQLQHRQELGFIVVGDGKETAEFDAMAQKLGLRDRLIRYPLLSQGQIARLFSVMDIFCFPTRRKSESLGLVGLEAIACGCTVVASDAYGPSSYMRDGENGFVFNAGDSRSLTHKVRMALSLSPEQKETLHMGMTQTTEAYSRRTLDQKLLDFFAALK